MNSTQGDGTLFTDPRARTLSSSAQDLNNNGSNNNPNWQMPPQHFGPPHFGYMPNQPIPNHVMNQFKSKFISIRFFFVLCVFKIN